jgi:hypothetical protein
MDWLDPALKPYEVIIHEYGVEDLDDLLLLDKVDVDDILAKITEAGAKPLQVKKARAALLGQSTKRRSSKIDCTAGLEWEKGKPFALFLSHFKQEAAGDARMLKELTEEALGAPVFLDSDDLVDLKRLLKNVEESDVLVLLQTANIFTRPWCVVEAYTAILSKVPMVCVNVMGAFPYNFADAEGFLASLATELTPEARDLVVSELGVPLEQVAYVLSTTVPKVISKPYNPSAGRHVFKAQISEILEAAITARQAVQPGVDMAGFESWKAARSKGPKRKAKELRKVVGIGVSLMERAQSLPELTPLAYELRTAADELADLAGRRLATTHADANKAQIHTRFCRLARPKKFPSCLRQKEEHVWRLQNPSKF